MKKMISLLICLAMVMVMTMAAVPFEAFAAEGESGSIAVETPYVDANAYNNYVNSYTFTAPKDGDYEFFVPAGLGVWERTGYWLQDPSLNYVDSTTNTAGKTFTLTMKAGEQFTFYAGTSSPSVTSGTITWSLLAPPDPDAGSIEVTANYDVHVVASYATQYTFTPLVDGDYTFFVPAYLGVWERIGYWMGDPSLNYVDCATNTAGKTFTLTLKVGESFTFYVGSSSPSVTSGTITWTRTDTKLPDADQVAAEAVIAQINEIGVVKLSSKETIEAVRAAYDALTDAQKALVTNYEVLTAAEAELKALEDQIANAPNSGSFPVVAEYRGPGQHANYKKSHTFTAPKDGEYTFFVPAGLGVWEFWGYWDYVDGISPDNNLYVDYATNTEGKTFTLTLKANEDFKFYVGTNSPDLTSGTITWAIAGTSLPEQPNDDQVAADAVIAKINEIGEVTLNSEAAIAAARTAYTALTDAQKALVTNLETLTAAEAQLKVLQEQAAQADADKKAADAVVAKINEIGEVTLNSEAAIAAARTAYTALTDAQKALVTNLETLTAAEAQLKVLQDQAAQADADKKAADAVAAKIEAIGTVTKDSKEAIEAARAAYDALTDTQKALVENYRTLIAAEESYKGVANTGDSIYQVVALMMLAMTAMVVMVSKKRAH